MKNLEYFKTKATLKPADIRFMPADVRTQIFDTTSNCSGENIRERLDWIRNDRTDYPECIQCKNKLTSDNWFVNKSVYREFCGSSCASTNRQASEQYKNNNILKFGVEHPLSAKTVQQKRIDTNLKKYGRAHPHPWATSEFSDMIQNKYGVDDKIKNKILEKSKIDFPNKIKTIEKNQDVTCLTDLNDLKWLTNRSDDITLLWQHNSCGTEFQSPIGYDDEGLNVRSCPKCSHGTSKLEQEIYDFVRANLKDDIEIISRTKKIIGPYELDIYIPSLNLAIEIDGSYWHSTKFVSSQKAANKFNMCLKLGIKLITIQESKYRATELLVKNRILSALNLQKEKTHARKCNIIKLDATLKNFFFSQNHLDGDARSSETYALVSGHDVVMAMSFGKSRFNKSVEWEIIRACSKVGISVVGGTSRLISHFRKIHNNESLITYADLDWGTGESYKFAGMTFSHFSKPNYHYIWKDHSRLTRYMAQKSKLLSILGPERYNPLLTEMDNMINSGYLVVYDRGNAVYVLN